METYGVLTFVGFLLVLSTTNAIKLSHKVRRSKCTTYVCSTVLENPLFGDRSCEKYRVHLGLHSSCWDNECRASRSETEAKLEAEAKLRRQRSQGFFDCTIQEVRIDACNRTVTNEECDGNGRGYFKVGVDYKMKSSCATVKSKLLIFYNDIGNGNFILSQSKDSCKLTQCPVEAGKDATFTEIVYAPKWADKEMTKWNVILYIESKKKPGLKCMADAEYYHFK